LSVAITINVMSFNSSISHVLGGKNLRNLRRKNLLYIVHSVASRSMSFYIDITNSIVFGNSLSLSLLLLPLLFLPLDLCIPLLYLPLSSSSYSLQSLLVILLSLFFIIIDRFKWYQSSIFRLNNATRDEVPRCQKGGLSHQSGASEHTQAYDQIQQQLNDTRVDTNIRFRELKEVLDALVFRVDSVLQNT